MLKVDCFVVINTEHSIKNYTGTKKGLGGTLKGLILKRYSPAELKQFMFLSQVKRIHGPLR
jgi:hypothetical protein